jgi:hypothetical protein
METTTEEDNELKPDVYDSPTAIYDKSEYPPDESGDPS